MSHALRIIGTLLENYRPIGEIMRTIKKKIKNKKIDTILTGMPFCVLNFVICDVCGNDTGLGSTNSNVQFYYSPCS